MATEYITKEGMIKLREKMQALAEERPKIIQQVVTAREMGDLSENAEYHAARERQKHLENEYNRLKARMAVLQVIDTSKLPTNVARFGGFITVEDLATNEKKEFRLVGVDETFDFGDGIERVSIGSPLGRACLGKKKGEKFIVKAPIGDKEYKILDIK